MAVQLLNRPYWMTASRPPREAVDKFSLHLQIVSFLALHVNRRVSKLIAGLISPNQSCYSMAFRTTLFLLGRIRGYGSATSYQSLLSRGCRTGLKRLLRSFVPKAQVAARSTSTVQPRMPNVIPDIAFLSFGTDANYAISKHGILDHIQKSMTPIHPPPRPAVLPRPPLSDDDAKGLGRGVEKYLNGAKLDVPAAYIEVLKYTNPTEVRDYHVVFDAQVEDLVVSSVVSRCREVVNIVRTAEVHLQRLYYFIISIIS